MGWIDFDMLESVLEVYCGHPVALVDHVGQLHEPVELELGTLRKELRKCMSIIG